MNKTTKTFVIIIFAGILLAIIVQLISTHHKEEIKRLKQQNEEISLRIMTYQKYNDSLLENEHRLKEEVDSLILAVDSRNKKINIELQKYEKLKSDFKKLPVYVRDSLVYNYIRTNQ